MAAWTSAAWLDTHLQADLAKERFMLLSGAYPQIASVDIGSIGETLDLITRKIQAVSIGIGDREKRKAFAEKATYRGAERIVVHAASS
jgi:hypothetical protein